MFALAGPWTWTRESGGCWHPGWGCQGQSRQQVKQPRGQW